MHRLPIHIPAPALAIHGRALARIAITFIGCLLSCATLGQTFPSRLITVIIPFPAGNSTDVIARRLQPLLSKDLGQPVVVENVAGASGSMGTNRALALPADGHTLLFASPTELILAPLSIPTATYRPDDVKVVAMMAPVPFVLVGRAGLAANDLDELLALAKKSGSNSLSYGSVGPGSLIHLISAQFAKQTGANMLHIPYRGVPPMMQDMMAGQLDVAFVPLGGALLTQIESGKLRVFGVTSAASHRRLPSAPPLSRLLPALSDFEFDVWAAWTVAKKTPDAAALRLGQAINEALRQPDVMAWLAASGADGPPTLPPSELDRYYAAQTARYQALARAIGFQPQ